MRQQLQRTKLFTLFLLPAFLFSNVISAGVVYGENLSIKEYSVGFVLEWTTITEKDCQLFEVQRSIDGGDFKTLGSLNAQGNSDLESKYTFEDMELGLKKVEYRLKDISADGTSSLSNPVGMTKEFTSNFMISGIDAKETTGIFNLTVNSIIEQEMSCIINSKEGDIVKMDKWNLSYGLNDVLIDLTTEEEGDYSVILKIGSEMEVLSVEKMMDEEKKANVAVKKRKGGG